MRTYLRPFSNGTEAMNWEWNNCDRCKRIGCYPKIALQNGYITGHITEQVADFIGYSYKNFGDNPREGYCTLNSKCNHFNEPMIIKPKINNEPKLF
jgi:hypothetical protein